MFKQFPAHTQRARRGGFTVIECLIAGMALAIFGSALAGAIAQSVGAAQRGDAQRQAADWLNEVLTRVDLIGPARISQDGPLEGDLNERFTFELDIVADTTEIDLYDVQASVSWLSPAGAEQRVLAYTRLYDPAGSRVSVANWEDFE